MISTEPTGRRASVAGHVGRTVSRIQAQYVGPTQTAWARAVLAHLRRSLGRPLGSVPEVLELIVDPSGPPTDGPPTRVELATAAALGLYSVHQQSVPTGMHVPGTSFGTALGRIAHHPSAEVPGVVRRFRALGTADDLGEVVRHARGLVELLRSHRQPFDYGQLAADLVDYQDPARRDDVRLRWGRAFYRVPGASETTTSTPEEQ